MVLIEVYSNGYIKSKSTNKKVIVLDLDETIGSFGELFILWNKKTVKASLRDYKKRFGI